MTNIELETLSAVKAAARKYVNEKNIDWEQCRYEIAKDVLSAIVSNSDHYNSKKEVYVGASVEYADLLIKTLKD